MFCLEVSKIVVLTRVARIKIKNGLTVFTIRPFSVSTSVRLLQQTAKDNDLMKIFTFIEISFAVTFM